MTQIEELSSPAADHPVRRHALRVVPILIVLALLVHVLLPRVGTIKESLETAKKLLPVPLALAVFAESLSYIANGSVLRSVIELSGDRLGMRRAVAIELGAGSVALVAAGALGYGASLYRWSRKSGVSVHASMLASWLPSMFDSVALVGFALIGAIELLVTHKLSRTTLIAVSIVVLILLAVVTTVIMLLTCGDWLLRVMTKLGNAIRRIRPHANTQMLLDAAARASQTWKEMRHGGWILPMTSSILLWTFDLLCLRYAFLATGHGVYFHILLAGYAVPLLLGRATFLPGGIAVTEVAMAALFAGLGTPASAAVVAVLTYRLISFWLPAIVGIPIAVHFR